jgi:hypothetical protein
MPYKAHERNLPGRIANAVYAGGYSYVLTALISAGQKKGKGTEKGPINPFQ